ncbi:MAG: serine/threonine protein kinase [Planctomycetaceae bacterium]|nr:serine/threonine protein kinase [Planctomycetaceae bacterium]
MIPEKVGDYRIERKIGSGGMGTVYLGVSETTGKKAAVKVLPASLAREEGFILRFAREVDAMRSLKNPHVVEVYESGVDEHETYFYAMEYIEGMTLNNYIRQNGRMPWQQVIQIAIQICSALKAAHDAGIVHRDLKPSNLLITDDLQVKLLDFGVAQVFASARLTKTGGIIGTAEYMSPEQAKGQRATKRSDIYSLGAVMYVMLTARPPFVGETSMDVIRMHRFNQFDPPRNYVPDMPYWLDEIICKCLEKEPEKRFPDALVLSRRLQEVLAKVELSKSENQATSTDYVSGLAETVVSGSGDRNELGGTLMRDLVKAELDRQASPHPLVRYFDNTYVLLAMLILVISLGIYFVFQVKMTDQDRYEKGMELYQAGPLYWIQARDQYLQPLIDENPDKWEEKLTPVLTEILVADVKKKFGLTRLSSQRVHNQNDGYRFLHMAGEYYQMGDRARAVQILQQLSELVRNQPEQEALAKAVTEILVDLDESTSQENQAVSTGHDLCQASLEKARALIEEEKPESARSILTSLITLYDHDPSFEEFVETAQTMLQELDQTTP